VSAIVNNLHNTESLSQALEESMNHPILIFKHSNACPISSRALREFQTYLKNPVPGVGYHLVTVQTDRGVSNEIEARLKLPHETPQAILVKDGRPIWNASHYAITATALADAIHDSSH
jgi:bacillithiol system protein YtxJ